MAVSHKLCPNHTLQVYLYRALCVNNSCINSDIALFFCLKQIRELQAEKQIMEQQRDIANTERERVITDCVGLKKKLEAMMLQRQKDAKDLSAMRHVKEKAFQVRNLKVIVFDIIKTI